MGWIVNIIIIVLTLIILWFVTKWAKEESLKLEERQRNKPKKKTKHWY